MQIDLIVRLRRKAIFWHLVCLKLQWRRSGSFNSLKLNALARNRNGSLGKRYWAFRRRTQGTGCVEWIRLHIQTGVAGPTTHLYDTPRCVGPGLGIGEPETNMEPEPELGETWHEANDARSTLSAIVPLGGAEPCCALRRGQSVR